MPSFERHLAKNVQSGFVRIKKKAKIVIKNKILFEFFNSFTGPSLYVLPKKNINAKNGSNFYYFLLARDSRQVCYSQVVDYVRCHDSSNPFPSSLPPFAPFNVSVINFHNSRRAVSTERLINFV